MENDALSLISIVNELEALVLSCVPQAVTVSKYGGTLFTLNPQEKEAQFCGVFMYSKHVQLSFSLGEKLKDPQNLLQGNGKYRRHINIKNKQEINFSYLKDLICQASKL